MKKKILLLLLSLLMVTASMASGCSLLNPIPKEYTEGVNYDKDYPDDALEIYDDAIVYESKTQFGSIILSCGTEDDIDDIIDFYHDFFEDNDITLDKEEEDRDEYYAKGISDEYEFEIEVQEADGKYLEDLFEYIILLSVTELSEEELANIEQANATPEVTATPEPAMATEEPIEEPAVKEGMTTLSYLGTGVYNLVSLYNYTQGYINLKMTFTIDDSINGEMFYSDYYTDELWIDSFTYELDNGILYMMFDDFTLTYYAYMTDDGYYYFENDQVEMYVIDWSDYYYITLSDYVFTAYGDWLYYYPENGYVECISFYVDGDGFMYNYNGSGEDLYMNWEYDSTTNQVTVMDENNNTYIWTIIHKGEVIDIVEQDGSIYGYDRMVPDILSGTLVMDETTEEGLDGWSLIFYDDGTAYSMITTGGTPYEASVDWYIYPWDGRLYIDFPENTLSFDYHYYGDTLYLYNITSGSSYWFTQTSD